VKDIYDEYREVFGEIFSVRHKITQTDEKYSFHVHDQFELMLVCSDDIRCLVNDSSYNLKKNTLLIFNNMDLHYISITRPGTISDRYVLYFLPEFVSSFSSQDTDLLECFYYRPFTDPFFLSLSEEKADEFITLYERMIKINMESGRNAYGRDLLLKFCLGEFLVKVNAEYREVHELHNDYAADNKWKIYRIIDFLHKNFMREISLDDIAKDFAINKFYLCSLFKETTGISLRRYLINCRMIKARELLHKNYSVEEVCDLTGYNNLSHFSRSFKQNAGISPKQYQQRENTARNVKFF